MAGRVLVEVRGPAISILSGERVALNSLQLVSGIATLSRRFGGRSREQDVHTFLTVQQVGHARETYPQGTVIVHPECAGEVVASAEGTGSTSFIVGTVEESPPGATSVIGSKESQGCDLRED